MNEYDKIFDEYFKLGIIEEAQTQGDTGQVVYLAHKEVVKEDRPVNRLHPLETNLKLALKDVEQNNAQEVITEAACRLKRETSELAKVQMFYVPGINKRGGVKYFDTYLM